MTAPQLPPCASREDSVPAPTSGSDAGKIRRTFERIAGVYDLLNRVFSFGLDALWRKRLADAITPFPAHGTSRILDLAAGTMEVSLALMQRYPRHHVLALDFCLPMLLKGLPKIHKHVDCRSGRKGIYPLVGDGRRLPLPDASVDAVTVAFGLRNIRPRETAYAEALRTLTPGGKLCVLEFGSGRNRIFLGLYNLYLAYVLPFIGSMVSRDKEAYRYLANTVAAYPTAPQLAEEMRLAGFVNVNFRFYSAGIVCLHIGEKPL
ncbi:MAG: ubiquinone/menaquinone biosynthesis methyltransferase [Desulfovibrio sp.]|jgi:demethylmenaquinone methyltransferase/2-methoxy-6-polyprenyl-1,4-benzoquinol methylase|nr:ubiquinone/menaquinone biosynthesis methyltransferase [Desulfovibrio sp.]